MTVDQIMRQIEQASAPGKMSRSDARDFMEQIRDELAIWLEAIGEDEMED